MPISRPTSRHGWRNLVAAVPLVLLALAGCDRGADTGATSNPVAPGRPGTGNPVREVDRPPGSITESPQTGANRWQVPAGITGSGAPASAPSDAYPAGGTSGAATGAAVGASEAAPSTSQAASSPHR